MIKYIKVINIELFYDNKIYLYYNKINFYIWLGYVLRGKKSWNKRWVNFLINVYLVKSNIMELSFLMNGIKYLLYMMEIILK